MSDTAANALAKSAPRHEILYARIKPINKKFLDGLTVEGEKKVSLSVVVDRLLDELRENHENDDSDGGKSRRRA